MNEALRVIPAKAGIQTINKYSHEVGQQHFKHSIARCARLFDKLDSRFRGNDGRMVVPVVNYASSNKEIHYGYD